MLDGAAISKTEGFNDAKSRNRQMIVVRGQGRQKSYSSTRLTREAGATTVRAVQTLPKGQGCPDSCFTAHFP